MPRSIFELRKALSSGELLTPEEREQLDRHEQRVSARLSLELEGAGFVRGTDLGEWMLRDLETADVAALRQKVRWLVLALEYHEGFFTEQAAAFYRQRPGRQRGAQLTADTKRKKSAKLLAKISKDKATKSYSHDSEAARRHLRNTKEWQRADDEDRSKMEAALTRRLRRARKAVDLRRQKKIGR